MKKIPLILALLLVLCCVPDARAAGQETAQGTVQGATQAQAAQGQAAADERNALATADANGGYSGQVLALISRVWTPPPDTINRRVAVRLKIDGEGNLAQCDLMTRSDMPEMNKAACFAAKEAGNFGVPPYGMPIEVYVTFWTGKPSKNTRGGKPVEDAEKPATSKVEPKPEPKGVVVKPEVTAPTQQPKPEPKGVVVKPETASPKQEAKQEAKQGPKPAPKGVPVLPAKADTKTPAPAKVETPAKPAAPTKSEVPAKPESKPAAKSEGKPAVSRGALAGDNDAATTPIKSSSSKAAPTPSKTEAPKKETPKEAAKKEAPAKEPKKEAAPKDAKKDSAKAKPGVRTDFAPYRDPKAKPEVEKPAQPSADQRRYAAEMTAWIQARIVPPEKVPSGKYTMNVTVAVAGTGDIGEAELSRSSGQAVLDEAVLRTVLRMEKVPPPPDKQSRDMKLTLTVHKP